MSITQQDITNPDLTRKVLAALNPNKIVSEDQIDKRISIVQKMWPSQGQQEESQREQVVTQAQAELDRKIEQTPLPDDFNLTHLNSIQDKDDFLKFVDTIYDIYPTTNNNNERALQVYEVMDKAVDLYQNKFVRRPYSSDPLNSDNFDKLLDLKEELRKKLYPEPSFAQKTSKALSTAASATGRFAKKAATATRTGVGTAASATGRFAKKAATATGQATRRAATVTGQAIGKAASATGQATRRAASATGRFAKKAATATGRAVGTAASATGRAVGTAASATGRAVGTAASATGRAVGTAARATRRGVGTAASATGRAVGTAASATGRALGTAARATGKALGTAARATGSMFSSKK